MNVLSQAPEAVGGFGDTERVTSEAVIAPGAIWPNLERRLHHTLATRRGRSAARADPRLEELVGPPAARPCIAIGISIVGPDLTIAAFKLRTNLRQFGDISLETLKC